MAPLLITRISGQLEKRFEGLIDMSDWDSRPMSDKRTAFLSRALAAVCVKGMTSVDNVAAAQAVTDGYHDNGVDAICFDPKRDLLVIVQSKWSGDGTTPPDAKSTLALAQGVRDILNLKLDRFNDRIKAKEGEIRAALYSERQIRIVIVTVHTANQSLSSHVRLSVDDLVGELNDPVPFAEARHVDQAGVYRLITAESEPQKIRLQISIKDWGSIDSPFLGYYGRVHADEIHSWWIINGNRLFGHNLRLFYENSDVNTALSRTLAKNPESFWYFNNGITVIADSITRTAVGAPGRQIGVFVCEGASIVNGAQTVGTIGGSWAPIGSDHSEVEGHNAWVQVRIISLEKCPPEFSRMITRAANLQNAVGNREFAAMDPVQHRLATEFALDRKLYAYKQGEMDPKGEDGCSIMEATQALACAHSIGLAVQAKREIGALWADTEGAPYRDLFNERTTSESVWRTVRIMRAVDHELHQLRSSETPRAELVAVHFNRVILHMVYRNEVTRGLGHRHSLDDKWLANIGQIVQRIFGEVATYLDRNHKEEYLAAFAKNQRRCEDLVTMLSSDGVGQTKSLFPELN